MRQATHTMLALVSAILLLADGVGGQPTDSARMLLRTAMDTALVEGDLRRAIEQYQGIVDKFRTDRAVVAMALLQMAECYQKLGDDAESRKIYERVLREFADQAESATLARTRLAALQSPTPGRPTSRQVWTPGNAYLGRVSPDGRYVGYRDGATGDLVVRDLTAGTDRRLTNTGGWVASRGDAANNPVISPDGRQVAYAWQTGTTREIDLRVLALAGGDSVQPRILYRSEETKEMEPVAWSPDGAQVLVIRTLRDDTNQIALISARDGTIRVLKSLDWRFPGMATFSSDGRWIAYDFPARPDVSARDILVLATDGTRETVVVQHPADDRFPFWSPDGSRLLFLSDRTGNHTLWAVPIDGAKASGQPELIKAAINVSPFSVLGATRNGALYYLSGGARKRVYVAELQASGQAAHTPVPIAERFIDSVAAPAWSPDGHFLAYLSFRSSPRATVLIVRTLKTGEEREILLRLPTGSSYRDRDEVVPVHWFPGGDSVLLVADEPSRPGLGYYRVSVTTGAVELLHYTRSKHLRGHQPALSPDGKAIIYVESFADGATQLTRFDLDTRSEREVRRTVEPQAITSPVVSPDGTQIAYLLRGCRQYDCRTSIEVISSAGGERREVYGDTFWGDWPRIGGLTWTPDQRYLVFVRSSSRPGLSRGDERVRPTDAGGRLNFWRVAVTGGQPEHLGISVAGRVHFPRLHPDGRRIAFEARGTTQREVWVLENFLPKPTATR